MRFIAVPAGETRQYNGPWYGVRVVSVGSGASVEVDQLTIPVSSLITLPAPRGRPFNRVMLTGEVTVQLADEEGEDLAAVPVPKPAPGPPGGVLVATWQGYGSTGAISAQNVTLPENTRGLLWLADCTTYGTVTTLSGVIGWLGASVAKIRTARQIAAAAAGAKCMGVWGGGIGSNAASDGAIAAIGSIAGAQVYKCDVLPPGATFPRLVEVGIYDPGITNRWSADLYAI